MIWFCHPFAKEHRSLSYKIVNGQIQIWPLADFEAFPPPLFFPSPLWRWEDVLACPRPLVAFEHSLSKLTFLPILSSLSASNYDNPCDLTAFSYCPSICDLTLAISFLDPYSHDTRFCFPLLFLSLLLQTLPRTPCLSSETRPRAIPSLITTMWALFHILLYLL